MKLTAKLFPHQAEDVKFCLKHKYFLIGSEMGVGKTLSAIGVSAATGYKTLVVCPAFLKYNWKAEFLKFTDLEEKNILIVERAADIGTASKYKVIIVNYERLAKCEFLFEQAGHVIVDEAHMLKNLQAKRTGLFHEFLERNRPKNLTLLTGTPVKNRVEEFFSLLKILSYCPNGTNGLNICEHYRTQYSFSNNFSYEKVYKIYVRGREVEVRKFEGLKNAIELRTFFEGKYIRRLTEDVLDLPELLERYVDVHYKYDDSSLEEYSKHQGKVDDHIMAIKSGSALAKAPFTVNYARNIFEETGKPVVIFSDHVDPVHLISGKLEKAGVITGQTSISSRHEIINEFQSGKLDYLVATIGAASTGITLTAATDLIFNDMSYVQADNAQASKRIHRIGQKNTCRIHKICGSHVDKMITKSLTSKMKVIEQIL